MIKLQRTRLAGAASLAAAMAIASMSLPTVAATNDALVITGGTVDVIELAIAVDDTAEFGNMRPDGTPSGEATAFTDAAGACYKWNFGTDNLSVRSSVPYSVTAITSAQAGNLMFHNLTEPTNFAECEGGWQVTGAVFQNLYAESGAPTAGDLYDTWLTVRDVNWANSTVNVNTTITFTATAS